MEFVGNKLLALFDLSSSSFFSKSSLPVRLAGHGMCEGNTVTWVGFKNDDAEMQIVVEK